MREFVRGGQLSDRADSPEARLDYLKTVYGLYTAHINSMLNFFLVTIALVANAFIQAFSPDYDLGQPVRVSLAVGGLVFSLLFLGLHLRSRRLLDVIEAALLVEERRLFEGDSGFLVSKLYKKKMLGGVVSHGFLVPAVYATSIVGFALAAWFAASYLPEVAAAATQ